MFRCAPPKRKHQPQKKGGRNERLHVRFAFGAGNGADIRPLRVCRMEGLPVAMIPKPPPPQKNKGAKKWDAYRQSWLGGKWLTANPPDSMERIINCEDCGSGVGVRLEGRRLVTAGHLHHIKKRGSHAEEKYQEKNIKFLCPSCHLKCHP